MVRHKSRVILNFYDESKPDVLLRVKVGPAPPPPQARVRTPPDAGPHIPGHGRRSRRPPMPPDMTVGVSGCPTPPVVAAFFSSPFCMRAKPS